MSQSFLKNLCKYFLVAYSILIPNMSIGAMLFGPGGSSGGDPDAVEFLMIGYRILESMQNNPSVRTSVTTEQVKHTLTKLEDSLNDTKKVALIEFKPEELRDRNGIWKPAVFDRDVFNQNEPKEPALRVDRREWTRFGNNLDKKEEIVAMEIWGLSGSGQRYTEAIELIRARERKWQPSDCQGLKAVLTGLSTEVTAIGVLSAVDAVKRLDVLPKQTSESIGEQNFSDAEQLGLLNSNVKTWQSMLGNFDKTALPIVQYRRDRKYKFALATLATYVSVYKNNCDQRFDASILKPILCGEGSQP